MANENAEMGLTNITDIVNSDNPVAAVLGFNKLMRPVMMPYRKQWFLNIAHYLGNQNLFIDQVAGRLVVPRAPSWRVRLVVNKILPIARTLTAKLTDFNPRVYVSPNSNDADDRKGANLGSKIAESIRRSNDFTAVRRELAAWMVLTGNAFTLAVYDEKAGRKVIDTVKDEKGDLVLGPDGKPQLIKFGTGDILIEDVPPFEVTPDMSTSSWREQAAQVRSKVRSLDYIKRKFGIEVDAESVGHDYFQQLRIMNMATTDGRQTSTKRTLEKSAVVHEMWVAPSDKFPNGRHIFVANKKELKDIPKLPNQLHGKPALPLTHMGAIFIPGRLMYMSPVENLIHMQAHYNRGRSQIIENINMMGRPKVFAPDDSIPQGSYTDEPGEIVEFDPASGIIPVVVPPPPIPNYHLENLRMLGQEMEDVGGIHEISLGRLPRRATSGVALSILEEKDNTIIAPMKESLTDGYRRTFSLALNIAHKKFSEKRITKLTGKMGEQEITEWTGSDLNSQDDVKTVIDSAFPASRAAKLEFVINLKKEGIIDQGQAQLILNLTDMTQVQEVINKADKQKFAQFENLMMMKGQPQIVGKFEDHDVHITEHKKIAGNALIEPGLRQIADAHIEEHEAMKSVMQTDQSTPLTGGDTPGILGVPQGGGGPLV